MRCLRKMICTMLALLAVMQTGVIPAYALTGSEPKTDDVTQMTEAPAETAQPDPAVTYPAETEPADAETVAPTIAAVQEETEPAPVPEADQQSAAAEPDQETVPAETAAEEIEEDPSYDTVPLYFQTDYPNTMYGNGTIKSSGCSITSLAMVATYLTDHEYLPDELARYFGGTAENNMQRLEQGAKAMKLNYVKPSNWHRTKERLLEGKIAIVLVNSKSIFTDSQHFIVLTGINEDGKIMVNDPYAPNYERWDLKAGFENGFEDSDIWQGYSGAWVFDKAAMPEEPFLYKEELPDPANARYPEIQLTAAEIELLARVVWVEARGESAEGQQAVAEVALNRLHSGNFGQTLNNVIYGEGQFRSAPFLDEAEPFQAQYQAVERALYGPFVLPEDVMYFATFPTNSRVWGTIGGHIFCYE